MKTIRKISENEMIAEFLKAEINSSRFRKKILNKLKKDKKSKKIVLKPKLSNQKENQYREQLLEKVRGFRKNKDLFQNFPKSIVWEKVIIKKNELHKIKYINYSYWNKLSNGTRKPSQAAKSIEKGKKVFNVSNVKFYKILKKIKKGIKFPLMIFVAKSKKSKIVVLEGHARLTSYFLEPKHIPKIMQVIIGYSNGIGKWELY
ncbi:MAG: hypothetical protein Q7S21_03245 [archaeon]|nr:hypothetical protein [archaeon]